MSASSRISLSIYYCVIVDLGLKRRDALLGDRLPAGALVMLLLLLLLIIIIRIMININNSNMNSNNRSNSNNSNNSKHSNNNNDKNAINHSNNTTDNTNHTNNINGTNHLAFGVAGRGQSLSFVTVMWCLGVVICLFSFCYQYYYAYC